VDASLDTSLGSSSIFSPDGNGLALLAIGADEKTGASTSVALSVGRLQRCPGTEKASNPVFAPIASGLGFSRTQADEVSVQGGVAVTLCDAPTDLGGSWGSDGTLCYTGRLGRP